MHVHILKSCDSDWLRQLRERLTAGIVVTDGPIARADHDFEVLVAGVPERADLEASPALESLVIPWAGLPVKTRELLADFPDLKLYNLHHNAAPAAEQALALMFAAARDTVNIDREFRANDWSATYDNDRALLLEGRRALILGYGAIGRRIARACLALGMSVHAIRSEAPREDTGDVSVHGVDELKSLLPSAEILFVCLPLTSRTEGLIGAPELALLPDRAIVVNIARGRVFDERALFDTLRSGRIRAGLDVWYLYPQDEAGRRTQPPSEYPFHELPNVVMTPHIGGNSARTEELRIAALADLIARLDSDYPPEPLDPDRGY